MSTDEQERGRPFGVSDFIDMGRYCGRAVRRHRWLAFTCAIAVLAFSFAVALTIPKRFSATVRILTKRSYIIPSLVRPQRSIPLDSDRPTRGAVESILSYGFREDLLEAVNLPELASQHLTSFQRLESAVQGAINGEADPSKIRAGLIEILGRSIDATLVDNRVLNVVVSWSHPAVATKLAEELVDLFLRKQKAAELDEIHDTVDIIRRNVRRVHSRLTDTTTRLTDLVRRKETELTRRLTVRGRTREQRTVSFRRPAAAAPGVQTTEQSDWQAAAQQVRQQERELRRAVEQHQQLLTRAEQNLARLKESLGPRHPDLQEAAREVEQARPVPEEVTALQTEIAKLQARVPDLRQASQPVETGARFDVVQMPLSEDVYNALQADPEVGHMMEEVRKYAIEYGTQLDRLEAAELEIDMSNAAFAHRYTVTQPPIYPTKPVAAKRRLVMAAGVLLSLVLALIACVIKDLASGRIRARWQLERLLGVHILGQVSLDDSEQPKPDTAHKKPTEALPNRDVKALWPALRTTHKKPTEALPNRDVKALWFALRRARPWRTLALVSADGAPVGALAHQLAQMASLAPTRHVLVLDAVPRAPGHIVRAPIGQYGAQSIREGMTESETLSEFVPAATTALANPEYDVIVLASPSPVEETHAIPLIAAAEVAVLCIEFDKSRFKHAREILHQLDPDRMLGTVFVGGG